MSSIDRRSPTRVGLLPSLALTFLLTSGVDPTLEFLRSAVGR
jgi:hypothetical protein